MNYIKVHHQDGLIYFEDFRVADLILMKSDEPDEYWFSVEVRSFDGDYSKKEQQVLKEKLGAKVETLQGYVWLTFEEFYDFESLDELDDAELDFSDDSENHLYFGWHVYMKPSTMHFKKIGNDYLLNVTTWADDANYYDERAKKNKVEIQVLLKLHVFKNQKEYQAYDKARSASQDKYFDLLNEWESKKINRHLSEIECAKLAWSEVQNMS